VLRKYELVSFIGLILLLLHVAVPAARAADVTLSWDRNSESTVVGYKLHYGNASRTYQTRSIPSPAWARGRTILR